MKKDIDVPEVEHVYVAAVHEENKEFGTQDWNAYLINDKTVPIEMVLMVSQGFDGQKTTSVMRHSLKILPAKSFAKIEFLEPNLLALDNKFSISFFEDGKMYHKDYMFKKNIIQEKNRSEIPLMKEKGIVAK